MTLWLKSSFAWVHSNMFPRKTKLTNSRINKGRFGYFFSSARCVMKNAKMNKERIIDGVWNESKKNNLNRWSVGFTSSKISISLMSILKNAWQMKVRKCVCENLKNDYLSWNVFKLSLGIRICINFLHKKQIFPVVIITKGRLTSSSFFLALWTNF